MIRVKLSGLKQLGRNPFSILAVFLAVIGAVATFIVLNYAKLDVLNSQGPVGNKERNLILFAAGLSLIVVLPVYFLTFFLAWKYRETNKSADYQPDWDHSELAETTWWVIPGILILILSIVTWHSSHDLDPFRSLASVNRPLTIQVVALDWKWLFLYPEANIATVNYIELPTGTPVRFEITADAPMNSFWIPQMGGQIYAMSGMSTEVNLQADKPGIYRGVSANISGKGFAGMHFIAKAVGSDEFNSWLTSVKNTSPIFAANQYDQLAKPSEDNPPAFYNLNDQDIYNNVITKYQPFYSVHSHQEPSS